MQQVSNQPTFYIKTYSNSKDDHRTAVAEPLVATLVFASHLLVVVVIRIRS